MRQYFGYTRVSTAKQGEKGVSLQEQRDAISRHAARFGLEISQWFEERETAAKQGRPMFSQMLRLLRQGKSRGVIIHKIDRSARNLKDWADLGEMIDAGIEVHFANESLDLHTRGGRLSADIQAVVAADYIRNLREETKKGLYGRLKQGIYPLGAPIGYLDQGAGKVKAIDTARAPFVIQAFELYATGKYSLNSLLDELGRRGLRNKRGGRLTLNGISVLLQNPFYVGLMRIKKTNQVFQGNHLPLVSKSLFDRVQHILQGKRVDFQTRHNFTFRRMVRCAPCGYSLIGELQKGHVYYRCHTVGCQTKAVREEKVDGTLAQTLGLLRLDDTELERAGAWIRGARLEQEVVRDREIANCKLLLDQNRARRARLTDAFLDGTFEKSLFEERNVGLLQEEQGLKERLAHLEGNGGNALVRLEKFLELGRTASLLYKEGLPEEKRDLVKKLTSNLTVTQKNVSAALTIPAQLIANREKNACSALERGRPRTGDEPRTIEGVLEELFKHFLKEPAQAS